MRFRGNAVMELVTDAILRRYLADDRIAALMDSHSERGDEALICQKWLRDSAPKRLIFERLYGDLLHETTRRRVLDVGGGLTCFTRLLAERHDYTLVDMMAHDGAQAAERVGAAASRLSLHVADWHAFAPEASYDVVVANDLFPNVDQRLALFLDKFLPVAREIRLSLTWYPQPRFYMTKRVDGDELFTMLAWDGTATARVLEKYADRIDAPGPEVLAAENASVYPNGRQVCLTRIAGMRG